MTKLFKYQKKGVLRISEFKGRALLADEQGLGKSLESLTWASWSESFPCVVVCHKFLKTNWERECIKHLNYHPHVLETTKVPRNGQLIRPKITIINYDILEPWMEWLKRLPPKLLIIDECHAIKNPRTKRAKNIQKLAERVPHVLCLSGTPLVNRPPELWTSVNLLWPSEFPSYRQFCNKYATWAMTPWGMQYKGPKHLTQLHMKLVQCGMIRRLKKDVLKDLPDKSRFIVPLEIEDRKQYEHAESDFLGWLSTISPGAARRAVRAMGFTRLGYLKRLSASLKLKSVEDWITNFLEESDEKIVVFGIHHAVVGRIKEKFSNQAVLVTGKTISRARWNAVDQFQLDEKTRLFVGNIKVAGSGLNLTAANTTATIEIPWTPGDCTQAEDRVHRIGQVKKVTNYYLVANNTVESDLLKIIQRKQHDVSSTLDGDEQVNNLDLFDELSKLIQQRRISNGAGKSS